jgi:hypothetical protein
MKKQKVLQSAEQTWARQLNRIFLINRTEKVKRLGRLIVLMGVGLGAGMLVIYLGNYFITSEKITDFAAKATILAGVLTFLGTAYTALYNEISSYYKATNNEKKWNHDYIDFDLVILLETPTLKID